MILRGRERAEREGVMQRIQGTEGPVDRENGPQIGLFRGKVPRDYSGLRHRLFGGRGRKGKRECFSTLEKVGSPCYTRLRNLQSFCKTRILLSSRLMGR